MGEAPARAAAVCAVLALGLLLPGLGDLDGPIHSDEAFYLSVATDMVDFGTPWLPNQGGSPVYQKPPLVFWAARASMGLFGRNAFAARLPGSLSAALVCALGVLWAAEELGSEAAPLVGFLLLGCFGVARFGRSLMLDLPLAAAMCACLLFLRRAALRGGWSGLWGGFFFGLSFGVKGPIGPLTLGAILVPCLLLSPEVRSTLRQGRLYLGVLLGLAPVFPWYAWMIAHHPAELWSHHVVDQYFRRFEATHGQPRLGLLWGALLYSSPFWPLAAIGLWRCAKDAELRVRLKWSLFWIAGFAVVFGLPKEHGLHYPLLVLTPLAVLAAAAVPSPKLARALAVGALAVGIAEALVLAVVSPRLSGPRFPDEARPLLADRPLAVLMDHPGPLALASGAVRVRELWSDADAAQALDRGDLVVVRDERRAILSPATQARLEPLASWRRLRPYLGLAQLREAWRSSTLAPLQENVALCRTRP
jgi:4-amino-4-deoxy-L-arabinose transferase-like glycosyltransferase